MSPRSWQLLLLLTAFLLCTIDIAAQSLATTTAASYPPLWQNLTRESSSIIVTLTPQNVPLLLCWYPISGNYCNLPRVLFYVTILAALVLRHHPWLYVGALAASLTYSGSAAIHACLLIWNKRAWGELDVVALAAILSVSCIVIVPLLNWSSTIRNAGRPLQEKRHQDNKLERLLLRLEKRESQRVCRTIEEEQHRRESFERRCRRLEKRAERRRNRPADLDAASRTILLFWAFLVTVGFGCAFVAVIDKTPDARYGGFSIVDYSLATEVRCAPDSGVLNLTAGKNWSGSKDWETVFITSEFLDVNHCLDPCPMSQTLHGPVLFRDEQDIVAIDEKFMFEFAFSGIPNAPHSREWAFVRTYAFGLSWIIVYILVQGVWAVSFGRSQPSEARIRIYGIITRMRLGGRRSQNAPGKLQTELAKAVAFMAYLWALGIAIIAVPLIIMNVTVIELFMHQLPQSESAIHIGAWSPYTNTGLALFSVFIANKPLLGRIGHLLVETARNLHRIGSFVTCRRRDHTPLDLNLSVYWHALQALKDIFYTTPKYFILEQRDDAADTLACEWRGALAFWRSPDDELSNFEARTKELQLAAGSPPMQPEPENENPASKPLLTIEMHNVDENANPAEGHVPNGVELGERSTEELLPGRESLMHAKTFPLAASGHSESMA